MKIRKFYKNQVGIYFIPYRCRKMRIWKNNKYLKITDEVESKLYFINNYVELEKQYRESKIKLLVEAIGEPVLPKRYYPDIVSMIEKVHAIEDINTNDLYSRTFAYNPYFDKPIIIRFLLQWKNKIKGMICRNSQLK